MKILKEREKNSSGDTGTKPDPSASREKELRRTKKKAFSEQLEKIRLMKDICYKAVDNVEKRATFKNSFHSQKVKRITNLL